MYVRMCACVYVRVYVYACIYVCVYNVGSVKHVRVWVRVKRSFLCI